MLRGLLVVREAGLAEVGVGIIGEGVVALGRRLDQ
jgi:hypothetical protein